ncbi:thioesterase II family protein [Streptomyces sp. NPDC057403]|uniref:thioesterase II family protein n=1 Tax=Streptomyces sp. NPDC057403 TaxID=3346119 RepID=UPI0036854D12
MPDDPALTLYCFAHAGAGVDCFHRWPALAGPGVQIVPLVLPGRGSRRPEALVHDRDGLLGAFPELLRRRPQQGPFAFYGHSLGGLVAYTLARVLADRRGPQPVFVGLGAIPSPDDPATLTGAADAPVDHLLEQLGGLGLLPGDAATAPGGVWHRMVLPVLRADLKLAGALRAAAVDPATGGPLDVPLLVLGGTDDPVAPAGTLAGWSRWSTAAVLRRAVAGDHFFVRQRQTPQIVGRACRVARRLAPSAPPPARTTVRNSR